MFVKIEIFLYYSYTFFNRLNFTYGVQKHSCETKTNFLVINYFIRCSLFDISADHYKIFAQVILCISLQ